MRVLFLVASNTFGDINPYLALTRCFVEAGDEVMWLSLPQDLAEFLPVVVAAGARILPTPPSRWPLPRGPELARLFMDPERYAEMQTRYVDELPERIEAVRALLHDERPDVIASDRPPEITAMQIPAKLERIPHAFVSSQLLHLRRIRPTTGGASEAAGAQLARTWVKTQKLYRSYGVEYRMAGGHPLSTSLDTAFTTEAFAGSDHVTPCALVGPCIDTQTRSDSFPWERLRSDGRTIYASCGSLFADERLYEIVTEAASTLDAQVVVSTRGMADPTSVDGLPGDVLAVDYTPQMALLPRVRVFVTHGGLNSVNESLWHGTPMLLVPLALDQWLQGELVESSGTGIAISRPTLTVEACRAALATLLESDGSHRRAALRVRESYRATNAPKTTRDLLRALTC